MYPTRRHNYHAAYRFSDFYKPSFDYVSPTYELVLCLRYILGTLPENIIFIVCMSYRPKGIESCLFWKHIAHRACQSCLQKESHAFLDIMTVFTKCKIKSEFTGKHDCKLITSLLLALHNYSSHAVVPLKSTSVFAAAADFSC